MDHKTTARSAKPRPGEPHIPTRRSGNRPRVPGRPRSPGCSDANQQAAKPSWPAQIERKRLFQWDEEPATPIAGYHGTHLTPRGPRATPGVTRAPNPAVYAVQSFQFMRYGTTAAYNHQSRNLVVRDVRLRVRYEVALSRHVRLLGHPRTGARAFASTVGPRARAVRRHGTSDGRRRRRSHCALNGFYRHGLGPRALLSAYGFNAATPRMLRAPLHDGPRASAPPRALSSLGRCGSCGPAHPPIAGRAAVALPLTACLTPFRPCTC